MMWALCVVVAVAMVPVIQAAGSHPPPNINMLTAELEALEDDTKSLFVNLTNLQFLLATAQEKINRMELRELADMSNRNENQQKLIDTLLQQTKEAQHGADDADAQAQEASDLAAANQAGIADLTPDVDDLNSDNDLQDTALDNLDGMLNSTEDTADSSLASALASLETDGLKNQMLIDGIEAFQDIRSCEYGLVVSDIPGTTAVTLQNDFQNTPSILTSVVGFRAHIEDLYGYDHSTYVDLLGFNVTLSGESSSGFTVEVTETADDAVHPKDIYVRFMACENLDVGTV